MAITVAIDIRGEKKLFKRLTRLAEKTQRKLIRQAAVDTARKILVPAIKEVYPEKGDKHVCPKRGVSIATGRLRDSVDYKARTYRSGFVFVAVGAGPTQFNPNNPRAGGRSTYLEMGTDERFHESGRWTGSLSASGAVADAFDEVADVGAAYAKNSLFRKVMAEAKKK